jgi:chromosome segregation ATPase
MSETLEFALVARVREVLAGAPATEVELRTLSEQADAWARALAGQIEASEARLRELTAEADSSLAAIADELRRVEKLRPELSDLRARTAELQTRARELRAAWLNELASRPEPEAARGASPRRGPGPAQSGRDSRSKPPIA